MVSIPFTWAVYADGYDLAVPERGTEREGVPFIPGAAYVVPRDYTRTESYEPMSDRPGLFTEFAQLDPTEKAVLRFVRRNGFLGHLTTELQFAEGQLPAGVLADGESPELWWREAEILRCAIELSEGLRKNSIERLLACFVVVEDKNLGGPVLAPVDPFTTTGAELYSFGTNKRGRRSALRDAARRALDMRLERYLDLTKVALRENQVTPLPKNLLGALWLQFALSIQEGRELRHCKRKRCSRLFFTPAKAESRKQFCSDSCRTSWHRELRIERERSTTRKQRKVTK